MISLYVLAANGLWGFGVPLALVLILSSNAGYRMARSIGRAAL